MAKKPLNVCACIALCSLSLAAPAAVLFSEDFSSGLASGTTTGTDYTLTPTGVFTIPGAAGVYRVVADPADPTFTNNYTDFQDHTGGPNRAMMFFDGAENMDRIFYRSANLVAGSTYTFDFWVAADNYLNTPSVYLTIDGVRASGNTVSSDGTWTRSSTTFVAQATGLSTFAIVDAQTVDEGNDGALDDISLVGPDAVQPVNGVPEPQVGALVALGLVAGVARRRAQSGSSPG